MATTKDFKEYVIDALKDIEDISIKPMMGEYLLYYKGVLFGGLYDNRFLVKKTKSLEGLGFSTAIPYDGAKEMFEIDFEDNEVVKEIINKIYLDLKK